MNPLLIAALFMLLVLSCMGLVIYMQERRYWQEIQRKAKISRQRIVVD